MKTIFQTIAVAFSMFSAVPMPQFEWNEKNMKYMMVAFPLIGALIGFVLWGTWFLLNWVCGGEVPHLLMAILCTVIPVLITGGVHLDGYADTCDALASHKTMEEKLEIMKDPHVGSFAVIKVCTYFLLSVAFWYALPEYIFPLIILMFIMSRTLSGLAIAAFQMAKNTGLAHTFSSASAKKNVRIVLLMLDAFLVLAMILTNMWVGLFAAVAAHLVYALYYHVSWNYFGGVTGDLAGWFLQEAELAMVFAMFIAEEVLPF